MRQLFLDKRSAAVKEAAQPFLDEHNVLVSVHYSLLMSAQQVDHIAHEYHRSSFSNIPQKIKKIISSYSWKSEEKTKQLSDLCKDMWLGHSCSGRVVAIGKKVKGVKPGDYVACIGTGISHHADLMYIPKHAVVKITDKARLKEASLVAFGTYALHTIKRTKLQLGSTLCVIGLDLAGQLLLQLARYAGCKTIAVDMIQKRLELAQELGARTIYNAIEQNAALDILLSTDHHGVDATIVAPIDNDGVAARIATAITKEKGAIIIINNKLPKNNLDVALKKEVNILMALPSVPGYESEKQVDTSYYANMQLFIELLESGCLNIQPLIEKVIPLDHIKTETKSINNRQVKNVIVQYPQQTDITLIPAHTESPKQPTMASRFIPATQDTLRVGFIGAGCFAQKKLLPLIADSEDVTISAIVDTNQNHACSIAQQYGAARHFASDAELLNHDLIDVAVIASPHTFHYEQTLMALKKGKAVFVENPMVTTFEQLEGLQKFLKNNPDAPFVSITIAAFHPLCKK